MSGVSDEHRKIADALVLKWVEAEGPARPALGDLVDGIGKELQAAYERGVNSAPSVSALVDFERRAREHEKHDPYWSPTPICPFCCAMQPSVPHHGR